MKGILITLLPAIASAQTGQLDLTNLHDYAGQTVPAYITKDNTPNTNLITNIGATLGRVLFYDKALSKDSSISCASCHKQEDAFGDTDLASIGVEGFTGRHSMRLINTRFADEENFFWDERASSLEEQTTQPIRDHIEMGFSGENGDPDFEELITRLSEMERYQVLFTAAYGNPLITEERVQKSLAQFIRSIQSFDSKYDQGRALTDNDNANFANFTAEENLGKTLFNQNVTQGGAGCASCHQPPEFDIDDNSGNNGVIDSLDGGIDFTNPRSPTLRDLVTSEGTPHGGFMHNAAFDNLLAVVDHYDEIPAVVTGIDNRLTTGRRNPEPQSLNLSDADKNALVAFMETLTGKDVYTNERWATPFDTEDNLSLIILPDNQITLTPTIENGVEMISLTCPGVPNVVYQLKTSNDLENWSNPIDIKASVDGIIRYRQTVTQNRSFYQLSYTTTSE